MYTLITVLTIIICAFIVLVVLVQNSKGGGFASGFSGTSQIMGARKSADFLEKLTWGLAIGLFTFCMLASFALPKKGTKGGNSELKDKLEHSATPVSNMPTMPSEPAPAKK